MHFGQTRSRQTCPTQVTAELTNILLLLVDQIVKYLAKPPKIDRKFDVALKSYLTSCAAPTLGQPAPPSACFKVGYYMIGMPGSVHTSIARMQQLLPH